VGAGGGHFFTLAAIAEVIQQGANGAPLPWRLAVNLVLDVPI